MTTIGTRVFGGEIPRSPKDKLIEPHAQQAVDCNFAYGELRPTKGGFLLRNLANAAKSIFSVNGLTFASWPYKVKAWKGPVTNDQFDRYYFTAATGALRVSQTTLLSTNGGEPSTSYLVGVPAVSVAPTVKLIDRSTLPDYPNATVRLYSYYETDGKRYSETEITTFTTVKPFREYTFTVAAPTTTSAQTPATGSKEVQLSRFTYFTVDENGTTGYTTVSGDNMAVTILGDNTIFYNGTLYTEIGSVTPVGGGTKTLSEFLGELNSQPGGATPTDASPSVRIDVIDTVKNTTIFSLSASSSVASSRSDAVPGGVDATLVKNGTATGAWRLVLNYAPVETRAYVVTMVNQWNEESKASPPVLISPTYLQSVQLTFATPSFTDYVACSKFRVYRSVGSGDYLSVTDSPVAFTGESVTYLDELLRIVNTDAVLQSIGWDMPPTNLSGLTLLPNGFFAAFVGDTLYFSEPYRPWAWPYTMTFPVPLVGMRAIENSLVVTTNSYPYVVSGVHPDAMNQAQLTTSQAGLSDHGMAVVGNTVAYVSNDGLAIIKGYEVDLSVSQKLWTREVWQDTFGSVLGSLELAYHDGALICGCPTAGKMWELRLDGEGGGNLSMLGSTMRADCLYVLPASDQLYYTNGTQLLQYKGGSNASYDWWSRDYILPKYTLLTAGYINTDAQTIITVYKDGAQCHQQTVTEPSYFRLPSGSKGLKWSFRLQGTGVVKELTLAERREELRSV